MTAPGSPGLPPAGARSPGPAPATAGPEVGLSSLPGPYPVGAYAAQLRRRLREFARVQLTGEVWGVRLSRTRVYFELRDVNGALPCSMWRSDFDLLALPLADGMRVVAEGGCDYYPGTAHASPSFSFAVSALRLEGEGDLLAQLQRLRRRLDAEGLFAPQRALGLPRMPRTIGVVTGEGGKARDDIVAALRRRGWGGRLVWAFAPVQDRHAAPGIAAALRDLAAAPEVEVVIVARGGGSLADLFAFCDESLCRTVALLRVPVIASVGHHTDRTLIDDVAAVSCSTPTHAAEAAVPVDLRAAHAELLRAGRRLHTHSAQAVLSRARALAALSRAPGRHLARQHGRLHQLLRELRASARRATQRGTSLAVSHQHVLARSASRAAGTDRERRARDLERLTLALAAHDPQRTLARGYALVSDGADAPLGSADAARTAGTLSLRFHDGAVPAHVTQERDRA